ncbi:tRNA synthetases class I (C) catalytic domain protein, partial [Vibrio parahaemolyticus V-223/04]
FLLKKWWR